LVDELATTRVERDNAPGNGIGKVGSIRLEREQGRQSRDNCGSVALFCGQSEEMAGGDLLTLQILASNVDLPSRRSACAQLSVDEFESHSAARFLARRLQRVAMLHTSTVVRRRARQLEASLKAAKQA
jgi:hypothetical protein